MALFEDESLEDMEEIVETNEYLDNPEKGIELIKKMLIRKTGKFNDVEFESLISAKILPILAELELENELETYQFFIKITGKIKEQQKIKLLKGKKVLGVGGKFSAGKSCFINSITNANLPEGQRPTTSVATYILNAGQKKNIAISNNDISIDLDDEAVSALTHQFFEQYKIGFSKLIKNLVVYTPNFTYPNIAILDTPGYSKSDVLKRDDSSDAEMARDQLKAADYLIWLVDSVQGVITQRDLEFISSLNIDTKILVVFTKASQEIEENLIKKIEKAKETLKSINKEIYDVIAYDSFNKETIIGEDSLEKFLYMINGSELNSENLAKQINDVYAQVEMQITDQVKALKTQLKRLDIILVKTSNIEHISAVVKEYGRCKSALLSLEENKKELKDSFNKLIYMINKAGGGVI